MQVIVILVVAPLIVTLATSIFDQNAVLSLRGRLLRIRADQNLAKKVYKDMFHSKSVIAAPTSGLFGSIGIMMMQQSMWAAISILGVATLLITYTVYDRVAAYVAADSEITAIVGKQVN